MHLANARVSLAFNFISHEKCNYALHYEVLIMCVCSKDSKNLVTIFTITALANTQMFLEQKTPVYNMITG